jgi:hypothetical protein
LNFFRGIYEGDFAEGSNTKAPRGFRFSFWSLLICISSDDSKTSFSKGERK